MKNWQQGRVLLTSRTRTWTKEAFEEADKIEKTKLFEDFSPLDAGKSRICVATFANARDAEHVCKEHNKIVEYVNDLEKVLKDLMGAVDRYDAVTDVVVIDKASRDYAESQMYKARFEARLVLNPTLKEFVKGENHGKK